MCLKAINACFRPTILPTSYYLLSSEKCALQKSGQFRKHAAHKKCVSLESDALQKMVSSENAQFRRSVPFRNWSVQKSVHFRKVVSLQNVQFTKSAHFRKWPVHCD